MQRLCTAPYCADSTKKRPARGRTSESKTGLAKRERSQASLCLEALVVVEVDVLVDQIVGLLKCLELLAVDAFCFQDTEKIFGHCVVIAVSASRHGRRNAVRLSQLKISV